MLKTARTTYQIGSVGFIAIGALHTATHALELSGDPLRRRFAAFGTIRVSGQDSTAWDLFQGTSWLMGFFSITIGLSALGALRAVGRGAAPPAGSALANMAALITVIIIGVVHFGGLQIWGGLFGIVMFTPTLVLAWRDRAAGAN